MTKREAEEIASTIMGPYLDLWTKAFAVLDPNKVAVLDPNKVVMIDPATGDIHVVTGDDNFEEAGGRN
jgi:hypothetical protein